MDHQQIINEYVIGKHCLLEEVKRLLQTIGIAECSRRTKITMPYLSAIKNNDKKKIGYQQLLKIYNSIKKPV